VVSVADSLRSQGLAALWDRTRQRLERSDGPPAPGARIEVGPLTSGERLVLTSLLGRQCGTTVKLVDLETALVRLGVGTDLAAALAALGHPVSSEPARAREDRRVGRDARAAARNDASAWPESWAKAWIDEIVRGGIFRGLDADGARQLLRSVRQVLDRLDSPDPNPDGSPQSRVDVAASVLGSAHALDPGTRMEAAVTRALGHILGPSSPRDLWERAGAHLDLTSGPALTWHLERLLPTDHLLRPVVAAATSAGVPVHLTQFALRAHPITSCDVAAGPVLIVENPRVLEAAAQRHSDQVVVAANGNPSGAVQLLVEQLLTAGARLRYHGDFDTAGLALCARMAAFGVEPWRMTAAAYEQAIAAAEAEGVDLPIDEAVIPLTPWDPSLHDRFSQHRRVVHEERLLPGLLTTF
jgi:uncharacterized protein (TIGR02679 family)